MNVEQVDPGEWLDVYFAHEDLGAQFMSYFPDYADPANYPYLFYYSGNAVANGLNGSNYRNEDVDAQIDTSAPIDRHGGPGGRPAAGDRAGQRRRRDGADPLAGLRDGHQLRPAPRWLQRLLVQHPVGDPGVRTGVGRIRALGPRPRRALVRVGPGRHDRWPIVTEPNGCSPSSTASDTRGPSFDRRGRSIAVAVFPAHHEAGRASRAGSGG